MSVAISQAQKQRYRITLDIEVLEDFNPHNIDWENLFELEGNEQVIDSYVEDLSVPVRWQSSRVSKEIKRFCRPVERG